VLSGGRLIGVDGEIARHPLASRALVSLGVLEVVDAMGKPVAVGGPAEAAVWRARHALGAGAHGTVIESMTVLVQSLDDVHTRTAVEAFTLAALASEAHGDREAALESLRRAIAHATPEAIWAPLLAHSSGIEGLVEIIGAEGSEWQTEALLLRDEVRKLDTTTITEALTQQEGVVLRFLPTLMSNAEIADAMHLSVNTVKTHLKALYRKLGVERRRDAVVRARQLDLLS
jgi:LuxR family maltose regulon positive regulatory protein